MRSSPLTESSADSAARAADIAKARIQRERARDRRNAAYVVDHTPIPPGKRRVLLDLAPSSIETMLRGLRRSMEVQLALGNPVDPAAPACERMLVAALDKSR